jgi:hypothetical protein
VIESKLFLFILLQLIWPKPQRQVFLTTKSKGMLFCFHILSFDLSIFLSCIRIDSFAQRLGARFFETSSVTGDNVDAMFQHVAELSARHKASAPVAAYAPAIRVTDSAPPVEKKSCC